VDLLLAVDGYERTRKLVIRYDRWRAPAEAVNGECAEVAYGLTIAAVFVALLLRSPHSDVDLTVAVEVGCDSADRPDGVIAGACNRDLVTKPVSL
jgi:hypothetical protein